VSVSVRNLVKEYPDGSGSVVRAVDGISIDIRKGELVTLLGPSGCGKTTTLRMIAGFEEPTTGEIRIGDRDVTRLAPHSRNAPMVFQSYALFPHLRVRQNASFGLSMRGINGTEARARVEALAKTLGLFDLLDRQPNQLSGGQQQRVALLRALVTEPEVLLFDEPLSNLDAQMRVSMRAEIRRVQKTSGITAVYVTHDQAEAMGISDRIVVMNRGRVAQIGTPAEVYTRPADRFVAAFLGEANFVSAKVIGVDPLGLRVESTVGTLTVPDPGGISQGAQVTLVIRPEAVRLGAGVPSIRAVVRSNAYLGWESAYQLEANGVLLQARISNPLAGPAIAEGSEVQVSIDSRTVHAMRGDSD
jgi:iron(III) transport system ATP-binding protein